LRLLLSLATFLGLLLQVTALPAQLSTEDHLSEPGFWPTQSAPSRNDFKGPQACAQCHAMKFASAQATPMGESATPATSAKLLHSHPQLSFSSGPYKYRIDTEPSTSRYSISDGAHSLSFELTWAFGTGSVGQSYLFKRGGEYYEARVTYFESLKNLAFTPSRALDSPNDLEEAMYRPVRGAEILRCFACHTTAASIGGKLDEEHLIPGVTCEACHGPGARHVARMNSLATGPSNTNGEVAIFNSADLDPIDAVEFCGACHGAWWDVKLAGVKGVSTARSAPYRLVTSKCWGKGDARLVCTACHDPHVPLQKDPAAYDQACLSCHVNSPASKTTSNHPGSACPKAARNCTTCHMQKAYVPEMNNTFTDHRIRVVKDGEPFPE
jgi:hypothetical protein